MCQPLEVPPDGGPVHWLCDEGDALRRELPRQREGTHHLALHGDRVGKEPCRHRLLEGEEPCRAGRFQAGRGLLQALQQDGKLTVFYHPRIKLLYHTTTAIFDIDKL